MNEKIAGYFALLKQCCNEDCGRRIRDAYPTVRAAAVCFSRAHDKLINDPDEEKLMAQGAYDTELAEIIGYSTVPITPEYDEFDQSED